VAQQLKLVERGRFTYVADVPACTQRQTRGCTNR
jgi:hypothetical protein